MTLTTHIRIERPMPAEPLFHFVRGLVGGSPTHPFRVEVVERDETYGPHKVWRSAGIGLGAMIFLRAGMDGPLPPRFMYHEAEGEDHPLPVGAVNPGSGMGSSWWFGPDVEAPACAIDIMLDTAYGFSYQVDDRSWGCAELHIAIVDAIADLYAGRAGRIWWNDEEYGTWFEHKGSERHLHNGSPRGLEPPLPLSLPPVEVRA